MQLPSSIHFSDNLNLITKNLLSFQRKTFMLIDTVLYMIPIGPIRLYLCQNLLSKLIIIAIGSYTLPFIIDALVHLDIYYDYHMQM